MNRDSIERRARLTIARSLQLQLRVVTDALEFQPCQRQPTWSALECEFGIIVTPREVSFCETVGTAIDLVETKLQNRGLVQ